MCPGERLKALLKALYTVILRQKELHLLTGWTVLWKTMLKHVFTCPLIQQHRMYLKRSKMGLFYGELSCFALLVDFYGMTCDCRSGRCITWKATPSYQDNNLLCKAFRKKVYKDIWLLCYLSFPIFLGQGGMITWKLVIKGLLLTSLYCIAAPKFSVLYGFNFVQILGAKVFFLPSYTFQHWQVDTTFT